jgi:hypothetical protein
VRIIKASRFIATTQQLTSTSASKRKKEEEGKPAIKH